MKARVKSTGVLVDVTPQLNINSQHSNDYLYVCDNMVYRECELDFSAIDWEQRRYELAKAAMQGYCANSLEYVVSSANHENISEWSVSTADAMIKRLKGGEEWHEFKSWYDGAKYGEQCIFRYEVLDNGVVISDYITAIWNDMTCDYLSDRISEYFEDYKITHWKPINKPKGVEK